MRKFAAILAAAATLCTFSTASHAQTVLKASHQFPGGKGDALSTVWAWLMAGKVQSAAAAAKMAANFLIGLLLYH